MKIKYGNQVKFAVRSANLSHLRQELSKLLKQRYPHLKIVFNDQALVKGGIYVINRKCGKPQCKCANTSYRHASYYLYRCENTSNQTIYLKTEYVASLRKLTGNYIKFRKARAALMKIEKKMAKIIDKIEKAKTIAITRQEKTHGKKQKHSR